MSATTVMGETVCDDCGKSVEWMVSKKGNWYLANMSKRYDNGARYNRGPHYLTCSGPDEAREQRRREEAAWMEAKMIADFTDEYGGVHPDDH